MATYGFQGTIDESVWSQMLWRMHEIGFRHGVWSGGVVSPGTGVRALDISAIDAVIAGIWHTTTGVTTIFPTANTDGQGRSRVDLVVAEANWAVGQKNVTLKALTGTPATNPVPVNPTLSAGSLWQMPLARVTVPAGATALTAGQIEICKPLPRKVIVYRLTPQIEHVQGNASTWRGLGVITVDDPGWSYRVDVGALVRFNATEGSGYMRMRIASPDGTTVYGDTITGSTKIDSYREGGKQPAIIGGQISGVLNGPTRMQLEILPAEYSGGEVIQVLDHPANHYTLAIRPA